MVGFAPKQHYKEHYMAAITRTVHTKVPKTTDIEIHVSTLETEAGNYTDIREYVVSLDQYGRGITFPARLTDQVMAIENIPVKVDG